MSDIAELKELEAKLAELKQLPERERQAQAQARREQTHQNLKKFEDGLAAIAGQYASLKAKIAEKTGALQAQIDVILSDLLVLHQTHQRALDIAQHVGQARLELGQGVWSKTGVIMSGDRAYEAGRALSEAGIKPDFSADYGQLSLALDTLRNALTPPRPRQPYEGLFPIVNHEGKTELKP